MSARPESGAAQAAYPSAAVVGCWAAYDLANTIFSGIVVTRYFGLYMAGKGVGLLPLALANIASMFLAGVASPAAGALMDRSGRGRLLLVATTLGCAGCTAFLFLPSGNEILLGAFVAANFLYNLALVFYNAYLPHLGPPERQGRISGIGTAVGYVGMIPALFLAHAAEGKWGIPAVFPLAGGLFLLFSLPCFFTIPRIQPIPGESPLLSWRRVREGAMLVWRSPAARLFFLGNFLCTDVLNALIFWIMVFVENAFEFDGGQKTAYQAGLVVSNIACSFAAGWLSDRITARWTYLLSISSLAGALLAAGLAPSKAFLVWTTVPLAGFGLGGIWTAGRKLLFELTPPGREGEYSGFYGLTGKVSSLTTGLYAIVATSGGAWAHRGAILALLVPVLASWVLIKALPARIAASPEAGAAARSR